MSTNKPRAIPFIYLEEKLDDNDQPYTDLEMNGEAIMMLQEMKNRKIAVLTISGTKRSGKSILANRILEKFSEMQGIPFSTSPDEPNGFPIGQYEHKWTKGIWIWSQPFTLDDETDILVINTEGLNSQGQPEEIRAKLFTLSLVLSSYFIYNQVGEIDNQSLEDISLITCLQNNIKVSEKFPLLNQNYHDFIPELNWILRDVKDKEIHQNPQQYFEGILNQPATGEEKVDCTLESIKKHFLKKKVTPMMPPLEDMSQIGTATLKDYTPEFLENVDQLCQNLKSDIPPLQFDGKLITGNILLNLCLTYKDEMNQQERLPVILESVESALILELRKIDEDFQEQFQNLLEMNLQPNEMPFDLDDFENRFYDIKQLSREFERQTNFLISKDSHINISQDIRQKEKKLLEMIEQEYEKQSRENEKKSYEHCQHYINLFSQNFSLQNLLQSITQNPEKLSHQEISSIFKESFNQYFDQIYNQYAKGTAKRNPM